MHFFFKFQHLKVHTAATILRSTSRPETGDTYFVPYHSSDSSLFREREFQEKTAGFKTCPPLLGVTVRISTLGRLPPALSFCKMDTQTPPGAAMEGKERSGRQRRWHHVWNRIPVTDVWGTHSDVWTPQLEWTLRLIPSSRSPPPPPPVSSQRWLTVPRTMPRPGPHPVSLCFVPLAFLWSQEDTSARHRHRPEWGKIPAWGSAPPTGTGACRLTPSLPLSGRVILGSPSGGSPWY